MDTILWGSYAGNYSCCEFKRATAMVFLEVTVLYTTHHLPLALIVFLPLLEHFQSLGRGVLDLSFTSGYPTVIYSL